MRAQPLDEPGVAHVLLLVDDAGQAALGRHLAHVLRDDAVGERPAGLLRTALAVGSALGVSRYGPEQLDFLRYRPVLLNTRLKTELGYEPAKTSAQAFDAFIAMMRSGKRPDGSAIAVMPFASLSQLNDVDLRGLHAFLLTLPARDAGSR